MTPALDKAPFRLSERAILLAGEPLAPLTSLLIGGPAELLLLPACADDIRGAIAFAERHGKPWRVIGSGTNVLVPDAGLAGLTIKPWKQFGAVEILGRELRAQAGAPIWSACKAAAQAGLAGLEFACGIPGTLGGAVFMNAGVKEREIKDVLIEATVMRADGSTAELGPSELGLGYRTSNIRTRRGIILGAGLRLRPGDPSEIVAEMNRRLEQRRAGQPINQPNCGSVFRNPQGDFAGRLIEAAGCKGLRRGGIMVSELHANFMVNTGGGTAADVLGLVAEVRGRVLEKYNIALELELELLE